MTITIPPPDEQVTERDYWREPWFRAFDDLTRALNDLTTIVNTTVTALNDLTTIVNTAVAAIASPTLPIYTVGTLPVATTAAKLIYVSDESGGAVPAFSDGVNWRRVTDRAIVS